MDILTAIKKWNEAKGGAFVIPKKGTPEFDEVKVIMKSGKAKKVPDEKKKIVAKIDLEKEKKKAVVKRFLLKAIGKGMMKRKKREEDSTDTNLDFAPLEDTEYLVNVLNDVVEEIQDIEGNQAFQYVGLYNDEERIIQSRKTPDYLLKAGIWESKEELQQKFREAIKKPKAETKVETKEEVKEELPAWATKELGKGGFLVKHKGNVYVATKPVYGKSNLYDIKYNRVQNTDYYYDAKSKKVMEYNLNI